MLRDAVNRYIELYQSMGFKYRVPSYALRSFADFAERRSEEFVRADSVLEWATSAPSIRQRHDRLRTVYRLACALNAEDQRHEVPPAAVFGGEPRRPRSCHIFTQDEIERLLRAASQLAPRGSIRPVTYTTLLSLIACTGLRISEALKLELSDITEDGLLIRATKFQKSRLVPLHDSATPGQTGCRLHDLRHTFAVRSLEQCPNDRRSVARHMAALSTYLGHAHVSDTYWYLQATPKLLGGIAAAAEALHREGER